MKRFLFLLLFLLGVQAQASHVIFYYTNWDSTVATNAAVRILPGSVDMQDGNFVVTGQPRRYTLTNGTVTISNMFQGTYQAVAVGDPHPFVFQVPDNAETYYASTLHVRGLVAFLTGGGLTNGLAAGTNVTFQTNGPNIVINSFFPTNIFNSLATNFLNINQYWKTNAKAASAISNIFGRVDMHGEIYIDGGTLYVTATSGLNVSNLAAFNSTVTINGDLLTGQRIVADGTIGSGTLNHGSNTLAGVDQFGVFRNVAHGSNLFFNGTLLAALTDTNVVNLLASNSIVLTATNFIKSLATNVVQQNQYWVTNAITTNGPAGITNVIISITGDAGLWATNAATGGVTNKAGPVQVVQGNLQVKNSLIVTSLTASAVATVDANKVLTSTAFPADATKYLDGTGGFTVPAGITNLNSFTFLTNITTRTFNITAFGASPDGKIATNCTISANTRAVTAAGGTFDQTDVGKVISIYGAGTNGLNLTTVITNVASATSITVSNVASTTIAGNSAVYGTDQTAYIQAAISFLATNSGGTLRVPGGIYVINGPLLDTGTNSLHHNAQIICPSVPMIGNLCPTIRIIGQQAAWARGIATVRSNEFVSYGSCFWSTLPRGPDVNAARVIDFRDFSNPCAVGFCNNGDTVPLGNVNVEVRDMIWRGAWDNNMAILDLQGADGSIVDRVIADTGWHQGDKGPVPTGTNGYGIKTAGSFNENLNVVGTVMVRNVYNGMDLGENGNMTYGLIEGCINAFYFSSVSGGAARWIGMANVQECTNIFAIGACAVRLDTGLISVYNVERYITTANILVDPVGALSGNINYYSFGMGTNRMGIVGGSACTIKQLWPDFGMVQTSPLLVDTNILAKRLYLYGHGTPGIQFSTNKIEFAGLAPQYTLYNDGPGSQLVIEHGQSGQNVLINDGQDNMTLGVAGKTFRVNQLSGTGTQPVVADASGFLSRGSLGDATLWGTNSALGGMTNKVGAVHITQGNLEVKNSLILTSITANAVAFFDNNKFLNATSTWPNDATKYLDGTGAFSVPAGTGGAGSGIATNNGTGTNNVLTTATVIDPTIRGATDNGTLRLFPQQGNITIGEGHTLNAGASGHGATILGGRTNTMTATAIDSTIVGGKNNQIGAATNSLAAGFHAVIPAGFDGSFVWSDSSSTADFYPSNNNSFNVRASGGVKFYGDQTNSGRLIVTNEAFFGTNQAKITPDGHFQSNPGTTVINNAFVAGDVSNSALGSSGYAAIGGGIANVIGTNCFEDVIAGGSHNTIEGATLAAVNESVISGGFGNVMRKPLMGLPQHANVISGGFGNTMSTNVIKSVIIGGISNNIGDGSSPITNAVILGGSNNAAMASFTIVAGNRAQSTNTGATVFADSQQADFFSTANNQFNIRAAGGLRLVGDQTVSGSVTATNKIIADGYFYSTNFARIKQQMNACNLIGISGVWSVGEYGAQPFNKDAAWHAASAAEPLSWSIPSYATNAVITFYAAADSARAWTNDWRQYTFDTGTRAFESALPAYPVVVTSTTPVYQSNSIPIVTGKTNSFLVLTYYQTATNTANNYYLIGPVTVLFE